MITVNIFGAFGHLHQDHGRYSMTDNRVPKNWKWTRNKMDNNLVTIFTDNEMCNTELVKSVESKYKVGMIVEPPQVNPNVYNVLNKIVDNFDFIITYNKDLINTYPNKLRYYPYGGSWIFEDYIGIYEKSKNVNMLYSNKRITDGHQLRHHIAEMYSEIDKFGSGAGTPFEYKEEILAPYRYSVVVENSQIRGYFSEKLLDTFALGTVPIYWGTPDIGDYFDKRGMIIFNDLVELGPILRDLTPEKYEAMLPYIQTNLNLVRTYYCQEDWLYDNYFADLNHLYDFDLTENSIIFDIGA